MTTWLRVRDFFISLIPGMLLLGSVYAGIYWLNIPRANVALVLAIWAVIKSWERKG